MLVSLSFRHSSKGNLVSNLPSGKVVLVQHGCSLPSGFPEGVWECEVVEKANVALARPLRLCAKALARKEELRALDEKLRLEREEEARRIAEAKADQQAWWGRMATKDNLQEWLSLYEPLKIKDWTVDARNRNTGETVNCPVRDVEHLLIPNTLETTSPGEKVFVGGSNRSCAWVWRDYGLDPIIPSWREGMTAEEIAKTEEMIRRSQGAMGAPEAVAKADAAKHFHRIPHAGATAWERFVESKEGKSASARVDYNDYDYVIGENKYEEGGYCSPRYDRICTVVRNGQRVEYAALTERCSSSGLKPKPFRKTVERPLTWGMPEAWVAAYEVAIKAEEDAALAAFESKVEAELVIIRRRIRRLVKPRYPRQRVMRHPLPAPEGGAHVIAPTLGTTIQEELINRGFTIRPDSFLSDGTLGPVSIAGYQVTPGPRWLVIPDLRPARKGVRYSVDWEQEGLVCLSERNRIWAQPKVGDWKFKVTHLKDRQAVDTEVLPYSPSIPAKQEIPVLTSEPSKQGFGAFSAAFAAAKRK